MLNFFSSSTIAELGHSDSHAPHFTHLSVITKAIILHPAFLFYIPAAVCILGVQQVMGSMTARLFQEVLIKLLNLYVFVGPADSVICIASVHSLHTHSYHFRLCKKRCAAAV